MRRGVIGCALVAIAAGACHGGDGNDPTVHVGNVDPWFRDGNQDTAGKPTVIYPVRRGTSAPLAEILARPPAAAPSEPHEVPLLQPPVHRKPQHDTAPDALLKAEPTMLDVAPPPIFSVDGLSNADNAAAIGFQVWPPDVNGDVGPNHYVQWVNLSIAVYDKSGNLLFGPSPGNTPWTGFGGACDSHNDGDPIVVYDQLADRWVFSQFALFTPEGGHQCFAVSQTGDPLGPYFLYDYVFTPNGINDYPKISVWPDGYYMSINEFDNDDGFTGVVAAAVDRNSMVLGLPAALVRFDVRSADPNETFFSLQPSHLEGLLPPPAGAPNYFVSAFDDEIWSATPDPSTDRYNMWAMHVDWADPQNLSTLTGPLAIEAPEFDANLCDFSRDCIPQPGSVGLDSLSMMTMYRLAYRNLGTHEAMVIDHTVDVGGDRAGIRWAEIRNPSTAPTLHQTGTFAPSDGLSRWMGSIAMDGGGNIAVGYAVSSSTTFPGLRYAARNADDPPGELTQGEAVIVDGSSSQQGFNRWGDYFAMSVDELDDCTFWFTGEYSGAATPGDWRTRIASFRMPLCAATEIGHITGLVTDANGNPLASAHVSAGTFSTVTNATGTYSLTVPAGTYDVIAAAFGYLPQTAPGIAVADQATVNVDFALDAAPMVEVHGWVYDGSDAGWPLYARLAFESPGAPTQIAYSDPDTGWYAISLPAGSDFTTRVSAVLPGYEVEVRPITPGPSGTTAHFGLEVNTGTCDALGYSELSLPLATESFEGSFPPAGWTVETDTTDCIGVPSWTNLDPGFRGNMTGAIGGFATADSDQCGENVVMSTTLTSPPIDLTSFTASDGLEISFNQDLFTLPGTSARIEIWDGSSWVVVANQTTDARGPRRVSFGTSAANGRPDARVRFVYQAGWDWWWQIDDIFIGRTECEYRLGGLVFGNVTDANTGEPLVGASVASAGEAPASTFATPDDPDQADGLYIAFMPAPGHLEASASHYQTAGIDLIPQVDGAVRRDFALGAGMIRIEPSEVALRVPYLGTGSTSVTVYNDGTADATVDLLEIAAQPTSRPLGPFAPSGRRTGPKHLHDRNATGINVAVSPPTGIALAAGEVSQRIITGLALPWGIGFDGGSNSAWVGNPAVAGGDDLLHRFLADGTQTGETIDTTSYGNIFGADLAYDSRNGKLWQVNVGGGDCIHEVDPVARVVTGETICPAFGTSERGLAYDPVTDTFYAGSWNDARIVQFDRSGAILRSVQTGLNISGLAYNSSSGHLFVLVNDMASTADVYVLDADLQIIGQFDLIENGAPAFGDFAQAGLELDCTGRLWAVDQATQTILVADSGETGGCGADLPWLSVTPTSVTVPAGGNVTVTIAVDAAGLTPGLYQAQLLPMTDTPYDVPSVTVRATVAFLDVPSGSYGDAEIHGLAGAGITYGCGAGNFCPNQLLTRRVYAVWGIRSALGPDYVPPRALGLAFDDVAPDSFGADFVEDAAARGYFEACGDHLFCADSPVTKGESAVTVLRLREGADYVPPPAEGVFTDVTPQQAPFIEEAWRRGIMDACGATTFCPTQGTKRADHAIWLVRAFDFPTFPI